MLETACAPQASTRRRHDRDRLICHNRGEGGARGPVERVLQNAGNAVVELRRAQHQAIAPGNRGEQFLDRLGALLAFEILVVKRYRPQVIDLEVSAAGELLTEGLEHR